MRVGWSWEGKEATRKTKTYVGGSRRGGKGLCGLAQDRDRWRALVNAVMNLRVPQNAGKLWSGLTTRDLPSTAQLHGLS
jgi:hypothetical protein